METKVILILGGYGNTGRPLARLLLQESDAQLILAGRNQAKAESFAAELNHAFTGNRARGIYADASDEAQLRQAFAGVDLVVVASSTTRYTRQVASAALATRIGADMANFMPLETMCTALNTMPAAVPIRALS